MPAKSGPISGNVSDKVVATFHESAPPPSEGRGALVHVAVGVRLQAAGQVLALGHTDRIVLGRRKANVARSHQPGGAAGALRRCLCAPGAPLGRCLSGAGAEATTRRRVGEKHTPSPLESRKQIARWCESRCRGRHVRDPVEPQQPCGATPGPSASKCAGIQRTHGGQTATPRQKSPLGPSFANPLGMVHAEVHKSGLFRTCGLMLLNEDQGT